ncbi:helix-turn-helix transcriptional regulator [Allomuricauda sp. NBRC 101325]|uniref:helix-turn-helix domain-containing protein n=1 Tax=Allomuricauda sp. NBRC 101325 TaxID=1113758 RepID=UPI0024A281CE|nr:helix-turn-helix transcriptional regulator [Muricauda sp. NBRC 101325]GLU43279.1 transcriptional regulator [Muricauda sp. NBRC 101325]
MEIAKTVGQKIRELRKSKGLLIREVAARLEIDSSLLSKIETGDKQPTRNQVKSLENILSVKNNELMLIYLSDKLVYEIRDEDLAMEAIKVAEQKIEYLKKSNIVL